MTQPSQQYVKNLYQQYVESTCNCGCYVRNTHFCFSGTAEGLTFEEWQSNGRKCKPNDKE